MDKYNIQLFLKRCVAVILAAILLFSSLSLLKVQAESLPTNDVWSWGYNISGQLGDGTSYNRNSAVEVNNTSWETSVSGGGLFSLALKSDGTVWAWGYNVTGQLGDGTTTNYNNPVQVSGLNGVSAISAGALHSLALRSDGTVWAWGNNGNGRLGDGTTTDRSIPVQVSGLSGITKITAGGSHSLALKTDGTVWAWGYNLAGQLGNATNIDSLIPLQVSGLSGVTAIAGGGFHSIALKSNGTVWTWGYNNYGQLGDSTSTSRNTPVQVAALAGISAVGAGGHHSLVLKNDGTVWSWGHNGNGRLGDGTTIDRNNPVQVTGLANIIQIAAGGCHSLALKSDSSVWAWGYNNYGQLGDGTTTDRTVAVQVNGLNGAITIAGSCFGSHSLAIVPLIKVATSAAANITPNGASLNGNLINMVAGSVTEVSFEWGTITGHYTHSTASQTLDSPGSFNFILDNLAPKTTYYFRSKGVNDGTSYGLEISFTTLSIPPSVMTSEPSDITAVSGKANGELTGIGSATSVLVSFEWGTSISYGNETTLQEFTDRAIFSAAITGLNPKTLYHYRAKAVGDGTTYGEDKTFNTLTIPPAVVTVIPKTLTPTSAVIAGDLISLGSANNVIVSFEWGLTSAYGNVIALQSTTSPGIFMASISDLTPKVTYHYRIKAEGDGIVYGQDVSFVTPPIPPTVTTVLADNITYNSAVVYGYLSDLGTATTVNVNFEWGNSSSYGNSTPVQVMTAAGAFSVKLTGLNPDETIHFRARAVGDAPGTGDDLTFTTVIPPGDVNNDRRINISDVVSVGLHWGETGAPGWIPEDVNNDGRISILDVIVIGLYWNLRW